MSVIIRANEARHSGDSVASGDHFVALQGDGNIVIYRQLQTHAHPIWASNTCNQGTAPYQLTLSSTDGCLRWTDASSRTLWRAGPYGGGAQFTFELDGATLVLRRSSGTPAWASEMNEKEAAHSRLYSFVFGYTQREFVAHRPQCLDGAKLDRALQHSAYYEGNYVCGAVAVQTACRMQGIAVNEAALRALFEPLCVIPGLVGPTPGRLHLLACAAAPNSALQQRSTGEWDAFLAWLRDELSSGGVPICLIDWGITKQHYVVVVGFFHGQFNELTVAVFERGTVFYCTEREFRALCWNGTWGLSAFNAISIRQP